jgi:hypothetical protein
MQLFEEYGVDPSDGQLDATNSGTFVNRSFTKRK